MSSVAYRIINSFLSGTSLLKKNASSRSPPPAPAGGQSRGWSETGCLDVLAAELALQIPVVARRFDHRHLLARVVALGDQAADTLVGVAHQLVGGRCTGLVGGKDDLV